MVGGQRRVDGRSQQDPVHVPALEGAEHDTWKDHRVWRAGRSLEGCMAQNSRASQAWTWTG
jgi:hypothetical protein